MHTRLYRARAEVCVVTPTYVTLVILSVANTAAAGGGVPEMMTENAMPTRRPHVPRPGTQSMGESSGSDPGVPAVVAAGNDTYDNSEANTVVCEEVSVWDNPIAPPEALYAEVDDVVADNLPPVPGAPRFHPQRASLTDMAATAMHAFLLRLALPESCAVLAEEAVCGVGACTLFFLLCIVKVLHCM
eukprot:m.787146 g.787146  ORF g.787146 m.787146 type:complete len:187 (-) comp23306_c0_seq39:1269-1829(-)